MTKLLRVAFAAVVGALIFTSTSSAARARGELLCGLTQPTDVLLGCPPRPTTPPPSSGPPNPAGPTAEASATPATPVMPAPADAAAARASVAAVDNEPVIRVPLDPSYVANRLLLRFRAGTSAERQARVLAAAGVEVARRVPQIGLVIVRVSPARRDAALASLDASPLVANVEKDALVHVLDTVPNDSDWSLQWGLRKLGLPSVWDRARGSKSVIIAVLDTGVDPRQPDLRRGLLPGFDLVNNDADPSDDHGHGTAVAGVIAARTNNAAGMAGVCWACSILPVKVLTADGSGDLALVAAGVVKAVDAGAHIINLSLGGPGDDQALDDAVAYAVRNGALVVAAAGNNGVDTPFFPASAPGVISVAATNESDRLYTWSNYGSWVAIAAPGCNVATLRNSAFGTFCGTSSAAPIVSGLLGLAVAARPFASRDQIVTALEGTTVPMGAGVARGRVDPRAMLAALVKPKVSTSSVETAEVALPYVLLSPVVGVGAGSRARGARLAAPLQVGPLTDETVAFGFSLQERTSQPLVGAINRLRRTRGLTAVRVSPELSRAAVAHVRTLASGGLFSHDWEDGTPFATWIQRYYPPLPGGISWLAGENLVWATDRLDPAQTISSWLASPGHRRILLDPSWRELGVGTVLAQEAPGAYAGRNVVIVAADFGTR